MAEGGGEEGKQVDPTLFPVFALSILAAFLVPTTLYTLFSKQDEESAQEKAEAFKKGSLQTGASGKTKIKTSTFSCVCGGGGCSGGGGEERGGASERGVCCVCDACKYTCVSIILHARCQACKACADVVVCIFCPRRSSPVCVCVCVCALHSDCGRGGDCAADNGMAQSIMS